MNAQRAYDIIAEDYDKTFQRKVDINENLAIKHLLEKNWGYDPNLETLDIGCGTGLLLDLVDWREDRYAGFDVSQKMIAIAKEKYPKALFVQANIKTFFFQGHSTDQILCLFGSVNYVSLVHVTACIDRNIAPGGKFFIMHLGKKYREREHYILAQNKLSVNTFFYSPRHLKPAYSARFKKVKVQGFQPDEKDNWRSLVTGSNTIGRIFPGSYYYNIVTGEK